MRARCESPAYVRDVVIIEGEVAFREISDYGTALTALAHGRGMLSYRLSHYESAHEPEKIIADSGFDLRRDDSANSVFCQKGVGFMVDWRDVPLYAHCPQEYHFS
jgi:translation elongation factor EF-G